MSATGRGAEREDKDFYPTPLWCPRILLEHLDLPGGRWLEPGAGSGAIISAVSTVRPGIRWTAVEIRAEAHPFLAQLSLERLYLGPEVGDFLRLDLERLVERGRFDVALGNPPFVDAAAFILRALKVADQVVMLLRLNFLGSSSKRRDLFEKHGVPDLFIHADRPGFLLDGGTDSTEYAWMRWKADGSQEGKARILFDGKQRELFT